MARGKGQGQVGKGSRAMSSMGIVMGNSELEDLACAGRVRNQNYDQRWWSELCY